MTTQQLEQLITGNKEVPATNILILAKRVVKETTDSGIHLDKKSLQDSLNQKEPMYVIASSEGSKYPVGTKVRTGSFMLMNPPLESALEDYSLVICREHDVLTYIKA